MSYISRYINNVGNTPLVKLNNEEINANIFAKLEGFNPTGSIKDRAASKILKNLLENGIINKETTIVESSSGNFGIALASYCKELGLKFICVIDPKILPINELLISSQGAKLIKVTNADESGGYLKSRLQKVKEIIDRTPNSYWINQYANSLNADCYKETIGYEICESLKVDYIFIGVSSGGTITGISKAVKEKYPESKVIAVDVIGSKVFGQEECNRKIPGIGSSIRPPVLEESIIDEVVIVSEEDSINMCNELLKRYCIFAGGSSGSVYQAIHQYFLKYKIDGVPNVVAVFADRGDRYFDMIYKISEE
ncbi:2,3-diaminopropionate biosynthesis protein SbnA [Clostridium cellulovorans]|uniref:N-(2-amino-2-carboxyethyl)-L-glutamate synthase n=1 Tax=Clostridium cellulovorans (strain ATCC 35296 / DSM 3052 / OCM 3 / 743B) TaxID=573061 RepID=D9SU83_CLOC7|nr:2,3-diaminopropionate biosynthesis protein SbnA [Clostridium cellulovorans]ADL52838.1 Pyridoxal-5'-phosphate-dependent protein beta subunit [Clostridium cellulovorans 743B]